jgi:hypothetical protein
MTIQVIPGEGLWLPWPYPIIWAGASPGLVNIDTADAAAEKIAMVGRVFTKDSVQKAIRRIGFRWGSVMAVTAGGTPTAVRVSLQDPSVTTAYPDETQDEYYDMVNGTDDLTAITWVETGNLSADRTVNNGDLLAIVWEFQTFNAGDAFTLSGVDDYAASAALHNCFVAAKVGAPAWTNAQTALPNVILCFSDGTYGTLAGSFGWSAFNAHAFQSDDTPDEYALKFRVPFPVRIDGIWIYGDFDQDVTVTLYGASTVTWTLNKDQRKSVSFGVYLLPLSAVQNLAKDTDYYLSVQNSSTASNVSVYSFDVNAAGYLQALGGGTNFIYASRTDGGVWTPVTTRQLMAGIHVIGCDDATGGAGGGRPEIRGSNL